MAGWLDGWIAGNMSIIFGLRTGWFVSNGSSWVWQKLTCNLLLCSDMLLQTVDWKTTQYYGKHYSNLLYKLYK